MPARTLQQMMATVQRRTGGKVSLGSIYEAINDAARRISRLYKWPWLVTESNIQVASSYTTGTINVNDQSTNVTGVGTLWSSMIGSNQLKTLYFGTNATYPISTIVGDTTMSLKQSINTGQNWTNATYTIYQDVYPLPADCEPGTEILIVNQRIRYRLLRLQKYALETRSVSIGVFFTNFQDSWCEAGYDDTTKQYLIKLSPPPSTVTEYKLFYRKVPADYTTLVSTCAIPPMFQDAICFMAEYIVKRQDQMPGWAEAKTEAFQTVQSLRQQIATAPQDIFSMYRSWPASNTASPSMYGAGLIISPPTGGL